MNQIKIGRFISEMRKEKGMTQEQLAEILSISNKTVSKWERGKGLPEVSLMLPLCEALEINVNELLTGECISNERYYKKKAEENMIMLIAEKEGRQRKSILNLLEISDVYNRVKTNDADMPRDFQSVIKNVCDIAECAMNNGLSEIKKFLNASDIDPFMKDLIYFSTEQDKLLSCDELFDVFSVRIRISNLTGGDLIEHLIMLQGYMYILHGITAEKIYDMLSIMFSKKASNPL